VTAVDILATDAVLTLTEAAGILKLTHRSGAKKGRPDRRLVLELVAAGKLRVVDPDQPSHRLTIATPEIRKYLGVAA
jgi:hypothetical protein